MGIQIRYLPDEEGLLGKGVYAPTFVCDVCGEPIPDLRMGVYVFVNRSEACPQEPVFAHKNRCHDKAEADIQSANAGKDGWSAGWDELNKLPARLANNSNPDWPDRKYRLQRDEER